MTITIVTDTTSSLPFAQALRDKGHLVRLLSASSSGEAPQALADALAGADVLHLLAPGALARAAARLARRKGIPVVSATMPRLRDVAHVHCASMAEAARLRAGGCRARFHIIPEGALQADAKPFERLYKAAATPSGKNPYAPGWAYRIFSFCLYYGLAIPAVFLWTRLFLGVRAKGRIKKGTDGDIGTVTVCNHVHFLDSALVALALFPRRMVFPTKPENVRSLWPGILLRPLGGLPLPRNHSEKGLFFDELAMYILRGRSVHVFPEGDLIPYNTRLRSFKKGAFRLAAETGTRIVPVAVAFTPAKGLASFFRRKPLMRVHIGQPILPSGLPVQEDMRQRMEAAYAQMHEMVLLPSLPNLPNLP